MPRVTSTRAAVLVPAVVMAAALLATSPLVRAQLAVRNQGFVPFSEPPIDYRGAPDDPVARLQHRLTTGAAQLAWHERHGYLPAVLAALDIDVASQMLVFSKTSFQYRRISPATPRAIYFNDDVYVGKTHGGGPLEIISFDAQRGAIFYLLDDHAGQAPVFKRAELDCTVCHVAPATRNVPGVLVRSVYPLPSGAQAGRAPAFVIGHDSPFAERFGGWYVTGRSGSMRHLGNVTVTDRDNPTAVDVDGGANLTSVADRFDPAAYLSPHSDLVAQLVHAHQTQAHNLLTRANFLSRIAVHEASSGGVPTGPAAALPRDVKVRIDSYVDELVRYLLFEHEAPLPGRVSGTSGFATAFQARGQRDRHGRSLRDFDLETRLFRYRLSYLVYTEAFDGLPRIVLDSVYARLFAVLTGTADADEFWWLGREERRAIFDILLDTKQDLPPSWREHSRDAAAPRRTGPQEAR